MRIRGVTVSTVMTHILCFLAGTFLTVPMTTDCELDLVGIVMSAKGALRRKLAAHEPQKPLYLIVKENHSECRLSDQPFFVWRDPAGDGIYLQTTKAEGALPVLRRLLSRRRYRISRRGDLFPRCAPEQRVFYGH